MEQRPGHTPPVTGTSPDGSPVELYLALPGDDEAELIHRSVPPGAGVLELGCGVGRVSRPLVALGHAVTGVDNSTEMLRNFPSDAGIETIFADITTLDLSPRRWPAVVLASHMVNDGAGPAFLAAAARHVRRGGCVVVRRYPPGWIDGVEPSRGEHDGVAIEIGHIERPAEGTLRATMTYDVAGRRHTQHFTAHDVDDARLAEMAEGVGLEVDAVLDDDAAWVRLVAT